MRHIALLLTFALAACNEIMDDGPADMQTMRESRPVANTKELAVDVNYDVGAFEIRSTKGTDLFTLNLDYDARRSTPRFAFTEGEHAKIELRMNPPVGLNTRKHGSDLNLRLNEAVPLNLNLSMGVSDSHLDMTDLDLREFHLHGGVGRTDVAFDHPVKQPLKTFDVESGVGNLTIRGIGNARVERLRVDGGVGRTELDFTGELKDTHTDTEINVGVGQVRLLLPREIGVTIEAEGSFLSNISAPSFEKDGHTYTHRSSDGSPSRIFIRVRSGVGGVTVELL